MHHFSSASKRDSEILGNMRPAYRIPDQAPRRCVAGRARCGVLLRAAR